MNKVLLFFLAIVAISCKEKPQTRQEMILGHWAIQDTFKKGSFQDYRYCDSRGFEFLPDSICDYKSGFFDYEKHRNDILKERIFYYLGTKTKYVLTNDSLKIFNLSERKWNSFKIKKFTKDSLVVSRDSSWATFVKKEYKVKYIPDFDEVIVSSGTCFGSCPSVDIRVTRLGDVFYKGNYYVINKGLYVGKISKEQFAKVALRFKQADYMNLKDQYFARHTDGQTVTVSFVKKGKIVKTIEDYSCAAPNEFVWAYQSVMHIDQNIKMIPARKEDFKENL